MVINQTLVGIVEEAMRRHEIEQLLGARHGVSGIFNGEYVDLFRVPKQRLEEIAVTPGAALGSVRHKPKEDDCRRIFEQFKKQGIRYFFYIGGDDSALAAHIINEMAQEEDYELRIFHVPKTIDNNLEENDHTPGFGSAARYVACAVRGDDLDNRSIPGIKVDVIMGRDAGWLAAASILARQTDSDGPHLVYLPEVPFTIEQFQRDVKESYARYGRCLVAVSEGIRDASGKLWAQTAGEELYEALKDGQKELLGKAKKDAFGHFQLSGTGILSDYLTARIKEATDDAGRVRGDTLGYPQRSFPGMQSPADAHEAREVGRDAVRYATVGDVDGSVAIKRVRGPKYEMYTDLVPLEAVAGKNREVPKEFISPAGNNIQESFLDYAQPLIGDLPKTAVLDALLLSYASPLLSADLPESGDLD
jgi:6-phosphofructokinase 1